MPAFALAAPLNLHRTLVITHSWIFRIFTSFKVNLLASFMGCESSFEEPFVLGGTAPGMEELPAVTESNRQQGEGALGLKTPGFVHEWEGNEL